MPEQEVVDENELNPSNIDKVDNFGSTLSSNSFLKSFLYLFAPVILLTLSVPLILLIVGIVIYNKIRGRSNIAFAKTYFFKIVRKFR